MGISANGIAVIAPIREGEEENCRTVLESIDKEEIPGSIKIHFEKKNITHFARFVIIADHEKGKNRKRLLFSAIFDGSPDEFFADMRDNTTDIDAIWSHCEGYPGKSGYVQFMKDHNNPTGTFLRGHKHETVKEIQSYLKLRDKLCQQFNVPLSDYNKVIGDLPTHSAMEIFIKRLGSGIRFTGRTLLQLVMALPRVVKLLSYGTAILDAAKFLNDPLTLERDYSDSSIDRSPPCREFGEGDEVVPFKENDATEDFLNRKMVQNQMTVISVNDPKTLKVAQVVQAYIDLLANLPFVARNSIIPTIHFGRWMMIDNGKRMLFLSNYDGNWQTYIGDFVDKAAAGLNAFWAGSIGWSYATTRDIELFKEGIRCHQTRASYFYCAYPGATVVNVIQAKQLYDGYHHNLDASTAKEWLKHL